MKDKGKLTMISALVTIYNPEDVVARNVRTISDQVDRLFLCDNSPNQHSKMFSDIHNAVYIYNNCNFALSKAFNVVLKNQEYTWNDDDYVIFFDQDSAIQNGHIAGLVHEYESLTKSGYKIGGIGPIYYNLNTQQIAIPRVKKQITEDNYIVSSIITSSLLCKYGSLREVDFWNEEIFLDLADWDLCWRMMTKGRVCIKTKAVVLNHALGFGTKKVGLIKLGKTAPIREYYQTRNYLYLLHKKYTPMKYKIKFLRNLTIRPLLHYFYLDNGKQRVRYVLEGFKDYRRRYVGSWDERQ